MIGELDSIETTDAMNNDGILSTYFKYYEHEQ